MTPIRVLVADSQVMFADALALALERHDDVAVVEQRPETGVAAVQATSDAPVDVVLLDYWIRDMAGPQAVELLLSHAPDVSVLVLSWFHGPNEIQQSLAAGAAGFLPKSLRVAKVHEAVTRVHAGEPLVFSEELFELSRTIEARGQRATDLAQRLEALTPRELEVLRLVGRGQSAEAVAEQLVISLRTVRTHIDRVLLKTGAHSQLEVVALARHHGLIP